MCIISNKVYFLNANDFVSYANLKEVIGCVSGRLRAKNDTF